MRKLTFKTRAILPTLALLILFGITTICEARVGGGRSFGNRGSRGFGSSRTYRSSPSYSSPNYQPNYSRPNYSNPQPMPQAPSARSSFLRNLGAGVAGGFLGSLLFRAIGGPGYASSLGGIGGGGGFGLLEFLLIAGLAFFLIRMFMRRSQSSASSNYSNYSNDSGRNNYGNSSEYGASRDSDGAAALMRQARPNGWNDNAGPRLGFSSTDGGTPIDTEAAQDLFFKIQAAWGIRDLSYVGDAIDEDARHYLNHHIDQLKAKRQINRLENIAVRNVEVVESWREASKDYSTVRINANVLDYTINEDTQQIVEGNKTTPVKFEEFWTFCKDQDSRGNWKLSAIEQ